MSLLRRPGVPGIAMRLGPGGRLTCMLRVVPFFGCESAFEVLHPEAQLLDYLDRLLSQAIGWPGFSGRTVVLSWLLLGWG